MAMLATMSSRLVMRFDSSNSFSFNNVRLTATDEEVFNLASSIASLKDERPHKYIRVNTRRVI